MTPYEAQSLAIARQALATANATLQAYVVADVVAGLALFISIVAGFVFYNQLKSARWNSLLSFEQDMHSRRHAFIDIAHRIKNVTSPEMAAEMYSAEKEGYLNAVDRLASSILNGHFPMKEMKQDYREFISNVIRDFPEDFQAGTSYRKVLKLYNKWQD